MDIIERLLMEHQELRRLIGEMQRCFPSGDLGDESLGAQTVEKLKQMADSLLAKLRAHEEVERRLIDEAGREIGGEALNCLAAMTADHEALNDIFSILAAISGLKEANNAYSLGFVISSLSYRLNQHMDYEEKEAFPCLSKALKAKGSAGKPIKMA